MNSFSQFIQCATVTCCIYCLTPWEKVHQQDALCIPDNCCHNSFLVMGLFGSFVCRKEVWFHVSESIFYSGVSWWTQVSSPVMILFKDILLVTLYYRICSEESHTHGFCCSVNCFGIKQGNTFLYPSLSWMTSWTFPIEMFSSAAICWTYRHLSSQIKASSDVDKCLPMHDSSFRSTHLHWNVVHHTKTCSLLITCTLYTVISSWWISVGVLTFACMEPITLLTSILSDPPVSHCYSGLDVTWACPELEPSSHRSKNNAYQKISSKTLPFKNIYCMLCLSVCYFWNNPDT
jgi:hypothetical protein